MKVTIDASPVFPAVDYKQRLAAIRQFIAQEPKTRENALKALVATGMHTKTGQLKKQFR